MKYPPSSHDIDSVRVCHYFQHFQQLNNVRFRVLLTSCGGLLGLKAAAAHPGAVDLPGLHAGSDSTGGTQRLVDLFAARFTHKRRRTRDFCRNRQGPDVLQYVGGTRTNSGADCRKLGRRQELTPCAALMGEGERCCIKRADAETYRWPSVCCFMKPTRRRGVGWPYAIPRGGFVGDREDGAGAAEIAV
ncbi:hypothetical protein GQ600_204 [Phytophthora cactorum]|nr:hypothetical protein GQ600_204 [Phytophthora cactorum]